MVSQRPVFFRTPDEFSAWLAKNGKTSQDLIVGFWKVGSGKTSITWPQAIVEAIAHGWIDGIRNSIDTHSYTVRFTPRRPASNWSLINVRTAERLIKEGRIAPAGLAAFNLRRPEKTGVYSSEQRANPKLTPAQMKTLKSDTKAWNYYAATAPYYQKTSRWWIVSAKKPETRARRLQLLIDSSRAGQPVPPLRPRLGKEKAPQ